MKKRFLKILLALSLGLGIVLPTAGMEITSTSKAQAEEWPRAKCTMTIDANKKPNSDNPAKASSPCSDVIFGVYYENVNRFAITGIAHHTVTRNGQTFVIPVMNSDKYVEADLTVYIIPKNTAPKPVPKPAPTAKVLFKGNVTASSLTVRSSNSTKARAIGSLKRNATVEVV
ncbi:hypothetical protein, partial [Mesobacillus zeae]|uniref:hypothetical protein n=1 Tax=Mesobacillus zeae TaxID=1917180 RepID=UPI003AB7BD4D